MAISRADFWSFITELVTRNPNLGIPALEDGLFANLLIFDYLYYIFLFGKGRETRGKGKGKGKGRKGEMGRGGFLYYWVSVKFILFFGGGLHAFEGVPPFYRLHFTSNALKAMSRDPLQAGYGHFKFWLSLARSPHRSSPRWLAPSLASSPQQLLQAITA